MFSDHLFSTGNLGSEVRMAPCVVFFCCEIESVDVGETRKRNHTANSKKGFVGKVDQVRKTAENSVGKNPVVIIKSFWNRNFWR